MAMHKGRAARAGLKACATPVQAGLKACATPGQGLATWSVVVQALRPAVVAVVLTSRLFQPSIAVAQAPTPTDRVTFDEALRVFRAQYLAHCLDRTTYYPGVEQALVHFERKRKAVATNKSIEYTNVILNGLGAHHFQCVVGGDRGFGLKPEPGMLLHVMEQLNVSKEQTVLVGDSTNDINGASETFEMFEATQPGWVSWVLIGDPAARSRRSSSNPHNMTASLDRA